MKELNKKLSFLSKLDNILEDNYNNDVTKYIFDSVRQVVLNHVSHEISNDEYVVFILHLDELIFEVHQDDKLKNSYSLPYCFVDDVYILLEE